MVMSSVWWTPTALPPEQVPPDPTRYPDRAWSDPYPCLQFERTPGKSFQCGGMMRPHGRCFRYEGRGRLWQTFVCSKCGRVAHDWKVEDDLCRLG